MRQKQARLAGWLAAAAAVALLGFVAGRALRSESGATAAAFDLDADAYAAAAIAPGLTKGGFSGFADVAGLDGRTTVAGRVDSITGEEVVLQTATGRATLRLSGDGPLRQGEASSAAALRPGSTVAVRLAGPAGDAALAVLILSGP